METFNPFVYLEAVDKMLTIHREKVKSGDYPREKFLQELQSLTIFANDFPDVSENSRNWVFALVEKHLDLLNNK